MYPSGTAFLLSNVNPNASILHSICGGAISVSTNPGVLLVPFITVILSNVSLNEVSLWILFGDLQNLGAYRILYQTGYLPMVWIGANVAGRSELVDVQDSFG